MRTMVRVMDVIAMTYLLVTYTFVVYTWGKNDIEAEIIKAGSIAECPAAAHQEGE